MGADLQDLPLFPLKTVLFPYAQQQLHVFEDRYRELVRACLQEDGQFGVVLIRSGDEVGGDAEPYMVGTSAKIVSVQHYDDGRMDIHIRGGRRFRIRHLDTETNPYLVGKVESVDDEEVSDMPRTDALVMKTKEYVESFIATFLSRSEVQVGRIQLPQDPVALSFVVANFLQIENIQKQHLLETTDTLERIGMMLPLLRGLITEAEHETLRQLTVEDVQDWISLN